MYYTRLIIAINKYLYFRIELFFLILLPFHTLKHLYGTLMTIKIKKFYDCFQIDKEYCDADTGKSFVCCYRQKPNDRKATKTSESTKGLIIFFVFIFEFYFILHIHDLM